MLLSATRRVARFERALKGAANYSDPISASLRRHCTASDIFRHIASWSDRATFMIFRTDRVRVEGT